MSLIQFNRIALIAVDSDPGYTDGQEDAGGQNVYVRHLGEGLAQQGCQVDIFICRTRYSQPEIVQRSRNLRFIYLTAGAETFIDREDLLICLPEFVREFQRFQQQEDIQYALIHTFYWLSGWIALELKQQQSFIHVHTCCSLAASKRQGISTLSRQFATRLKIEQACLQSADQIVATNPHEESYLRALVSPKERVYFIPAGVDTDRFGGISREVARQTLGISEKAAVVLYVGRFDSQKGIATLIRAAARSQFLRRHLKLIIAADGPKLGRFNLERQRVHEFVSILNLTHCTEFPGYLNEKLPLYYAAADVCVAPSYCQTLGLVALEAMASRTPVVASRVDGLQSTVIPEVTGLLVPPKDDIALAEAIDRILLDPEWRDQLGGTGRLQVEIAFTWGIVASRHHQLYYSLLKQSAPDFRLKMTASI